MLSKKELKKCQHPRGRWLFYFTAFPMVTLLLSFLLWWMINPSSMREWVKTDIITTADVANLIIGDVDQGTTKVNVEKGSKRQLSAEEKTTVEIVRNDILVPLVASPLTPAIILISFFLLILAIMGKTYGTNFGGGILLSKKQFPEVYKMTKKMAQEIGLRKTPDILLVNGNGALNAFACTVPAVRNAIIIYSDIFHGCLSKNDWQSLQFIIGHELGHIKFNHTKWWYNFLSMPLNFIPGVNVVLGRAISRANEYSCDKLGAKLSHDKTGKSLMILQAGKHDYQNVNFEEFVEQQDRGNIWVTVSNWFMDHPITLWRIMAIKRNHHGGLWFRKK